MKPDKGQLVYFVSPGLVTETLAAFVAKRITEDIANLHVISASGTAYGLTKVPYDPTGTPGTWHFTTDVTVNAAEA